MKTKTMLSALCAAALVFSSFSPMSITASGESEVVFDASTFESFKDRTAQQVADEYAKARYAGETYVNSDSSSYYSTPASTSAPYNAGVLTDDTHKAMTEMANFHRWLAGEYPLKVSSTHSDKLQAEALDRNFEWGHVISESSKPEDMDDELWQLGLSCTHNILAGGYTPQGEITGWINEGYDISDGSWGTLGHRHAIISPTVSGLQFGHAGGIGVGKILGYENEYKEPFSAFPAPGYVPNSLVYPYESAWNVYLDTSRVYAGDKSGIVVKVTNLNSGASYECTADNGKLSAGSSTISFVQPDDYDSSSRRYTDSYSVEITGAVDAASGSPAKLVYTVNFFDPSDLMPSVVKSAGVKNNNYIVYKDSASDEMIKKITAILPKTALVTAESGKTFELPIKGEWVFDADNSRWTASLDKADLPDNITDRNNVLGEIEIHYTVSDDFYDMYNSLSMPTEIGEGQTGTVSVYRTLRSTDMSQVFRLIPNGGTYSSKEFLNSATSPEFDQKAFEENSVYHKYNVTFTPEDSGEYISVYYYSTPYWHDVYVSNSTRTVNVISTGNTDNSDSSDNTDIIDNTDSDTSTDDTDTSSDDIDSTDNTDTDTDASSDNTDVTDNTDSDASSDDTDITGDTDSDTSSDDTDSTGDTDSYTSSDDTDITDNTDSDTSSDDTDSTGDTDSDTSSDDTDSTGDTDTDTSSDDTDITVDTDSDTSSDDTTDTDTYEPDTDMPYVSAILGDVDGDGMLTSSDALDILRYSVNASVNDLIGTEILVVI